MAAAAAVAAVVALFWAPNKPANWRPGPNSMLGQSAEQTELPISSATLTPTRFGSCPSHYLVDLVANQPAAS